MFIWRRSMKILFDSWKDISWWVWVRNRIESYIILYYKRIRVAVLFARKSDIMYIVQSSINKYTGESFESRETSRPARGRCPRVNPFARKPISWFLVSACGFERPLTWAPPDPRWPWYHLMTSMPEAPKPSRPIHHCPNSLGHHPQHSILTTLSLSQPQFPSPTLHP